MENNIRNIKIEFDKRLELLFGLQYCVSKEYNMNFIWLTNNDEKYCNKFYELYQNYASEKLKQYIRNGGFDSFDRTLSIALSLDDNFQIIINEKINEIIKSNLFFNPKDLNRLLGDFIKKSNYLNFYNKNKRYYESKISIMKNLLNKENFDENTLITFFGYKIKQFKIKLLNFSYGSYGIETDNSIEYVRSVYKLEEQVHILPNVYHEFSHPYVNPLGYKYFSNIDLINLLNTAKNNGLEICYNNGISLINEYIVRALAIYLCKNILSDDYIARSIERNKKVGYKFIEDLIIILNEKKKYDSFEIFYKEYIFTFFLKLNNTIL